jgi:hypothetical protein
MMENENIQQEHEETHINGNAEEPLDLARSVRELTTVVNVAVQAIAVRPKILHHVLFFCIVCFVNFSKNEVWFM